MIVGSDSLATINLLLRLVFGSLGAAHNSSPEAGISHTKLPDRHVPKAVPRNVRASSRLKCAAMAGRIKLYDTTLRDGAQSEDVSFTLDDKLRVAELLDGCGIA
jgi:hypothetical protein